MNLPYNSDICFTLEDPTRPWRVAYTKGRHEKKFADVCIESAIPIFLPVQKHKRRKRGRTWYVNVPLFPNYAFLRCTGEERETAYSGNHVVRILPVRDQAQLEEDLRRVKRALDGHVPMEPYPFAQVGKRVRVARGPMKGLEGTIRRHRGDYRFLITVRMIKQSVSVDIDAEMLEPI
jgi:transcription antitermination factor NusG